jgi:3-dehydroquinate synthase
MTESSSQTVTVELGARSYEIAIADGALARVGEFVEAWGNWPATERRAAVVTDENVVPHARTVIASLRKHGWSARLMSVPSGERSKSQQVLSGLYDELVEMQADRRTLVVAVGGGVVGDLAGFLAASYARGVPFVQVPTTLLADVDSSVGGKVGINHPKAKNLIGAFHQPAGVVIDTEALHTLPDREFISGLAEVVKYGVILDADFFEYLESHASQINARQPEALQYAIARSCRLKADVVEQDEFERTGLRAVLNYGHTFAHAYEALAGYGELLHGEAVSIGMVHASLLAERHGLIPADVTRRQIELLQVLHLPVHLPSLTWTADDVLDRMRLDKKTQGRRLRFILPSRIGHVQMYDDVLEEEVRGVIDSAGKAL